MSRYINKYLKYVAIFSFIIVTIASSIIYFTNYNNKEIAKLSTLNSAIAEAFDQEVDRVVYLEKVTDRISNIKIRYISENIIYDSHSQSKELFTLTPGTFKHSSNQWTKNNLEVVKELKDGSMLSITCNEDNYFGVLLHLLPMYLISLGAIFIFTRFMGKQSLDKIMTPMYNYEKTGDLDYMMKVPELSSFAQVLLKEKLVNENKIEEIKRERDTINTILSNMKEGLLILDAKRRILMINAETAELLETTEEAIGKSILYVTRREELAVAIEQCYMGNFTQGKIAVEDKYVKYYANPVYYNNEITGAVLLLIDETERIKAEKIREEFSANVSHELKTPLTSIYGFAELLSTNMITEEKDRQEIVERIFEESKRLLTLIDEIIKISKLESGVMLAEEEIELKNLAKSLYNNFETSAKKRNINLKIVGQGVFWSNTIMIWELVANLIENAIKYNVDNGEVNVSMKVGKEVEFIVEDTGIGIAEEDKSRIFERFYRVEKSRNKKRGGTGLGLSIVKHIVKNLKGRIEVDSELGKGTRIHIKIPKKEIY